MKKMIYKSPELRVKAFEVLPAVCVLSNLNSREVGSLGSMSGGWDEED